jgi:GTP-binding protein
MIKTAQFIKSTQDYRKCPIPDRPEYAFIGRSNVGKSSLINMLTGKRDLAKTSQTPGKTQLINHFMVNNSWYLVDLPGYGYAKVAKTERAKWDTMIWEYLKNRENLMCVFVLIDVRHEPQKVDVEFINELGELQIPLKIIFTKADKLGTGVAQKNVNSYLQFLSLTWSDLPDTFISSAEKMVGREDILKNIVEMNKLYK